MTQTPLISSTSSFLCRHFIVVNSDAITDNVAVFISTLFILEFGADKFLDHTAIVARRTGIPDTVIALLTASAEWKELVAVVTSLAQCRPSLAMGNIIGSAISNILGWAISRGSLTAPEGSDDDSSSDESDTSSTESTSRVRRPLLPSHEDREPENTNERDPRVAGSPSVAGVTNVSSHRRSRSLGYHIWFLVLGFLAICLSGYILSHAAINVADGIDISGVVFGIVILAIATTLPEKFVAVLSGNRGHVGILVANTVGISVFLLSPCLGIVMVDTSGNFNGGNINVPKLSVFWGSTLALTITVWYGESFDRWIGGTIR
ncbi:Ca2+ transporter [Fusarium circinatum]|uniref:Ca2+ transporter n=1 Tax=Fusarium circinatum TaxID=48490 RepID=A0A8H5WST3_FUSCI|nr:Ca2+ transporter [Fusarium circinatum]